MTKYARPLILALALLALGASITALYVHYRILEDPTYTSFCDINETVSCEAVLESPYATVRGVPVAAGGVIWSTLVLLIAATGLRPSGCRLSCTWGMPRSSSSARCARYA